MAPASLLDLVSALPSTEGWGPSVSEETMLDGIPFAPYSKADKLGRMADWTDGKDRDRGGRQQYGNRNYRDQQVAEEEATFSVVDNTRTSARTRGFGRGGGTRGGRGTFQRVGGRGGQGGYNDRGGRGGGRGGRRFGRWDDKPQRNRDPSVQLNLDTGEGEDLDSYGFLYYYDRSYDKQPGAKTSERKLKELADKDEATVFATDNVLSMLMCATKSVYSWDLVFTKRGNQVFIDKRDQSNLDMVTVNENAADAPLEISEGNKVSINSPGALMLEATHINNVFPLQVVVESENQKVSMAHEHPFYNEEVESDPAASKAYRYRRFDLSLEKDEEPLHLIVRTELDAVVKNNINGEDQFLTIKALNEFDNKAQGAGGALDWRSKLSSQRGAVLATEMKNNSCKLARWTVQSILAKADTMKLGFVSRTNPKNNNDHVVLGVLTNKPREFATQMALNLNNGWGIVRTIVDMVLRMDEGKYVLIKDPNKAVLRLYNVPLHTFEEDEEAELGQVEEEDE
ncbi:translation initiation factor [Ascochyta rabiei]|uniref:Eukaryotic translation initiation factor 3 subunit D n=1 Tax=Didymella rabiei TaxID=5454 RepID=A0A163FQ34_DIDRA|nr:translation initiation factor [Ascochyta rabiei]